MNVRVSRSTRWTLFKLHNLHFGAMALELSSFVALTASVLESQDLDFSWDDHEAVSPFVLLSSCLLAFYKLPRLLRHPPRRHCEVAGGENLNVRKEVRYDTTPLTKEIYTLLPTHRYVYKA